MPHQSLGALDFLVHNGRELTAQQSFLPAWDCLERMQNEEILRGHHLTRHMRAILVDWMIEVAV